MCGKVDPLSLFEINKNGKRDLSSEYKALGALGLIQSSMLEHELRLIHREIARPYTEVATEDQEDFEVRSGVVEALHAMKQTLRERDKEIESLRHALGEMGNSVSWKVTEPLRRLKGSFR